MSTVTSRRIPRMVPSRSQAIEIAGRLPGVIRREKMLAPIFDPFDRTRQLSRNAGYEKIFRIKLPPNPETTSGIADLHHERALRKSEHFCERGPVEKGHLGDAEYDHALLCGIPIGNEPPCLQGNSRVALHVECFPSHIVGSSKRRLGVAPAHIDPRKICSSQLVNKNVGFPRRFPIQDRVQLLDLGGDQRRGVFGEVWACRDCHRHRFADVTNLVRRDRKLKKFFEARHGCKPRPDRAKEAGKIGLREYPDHPGQRRGRFRVDAPYAPMRPGTSEHGRIQHPVQMNIVHIIPIALQKSRIFQPGNRLADLRHFPFRFETLSGHAFTSLRRATFVLWPLLTRLRQIVRV